MSIKSWKAEFYPITAKQAAKKLDLVGLVEHSIQKWTGLRKSNLKKHGLEPSGFFHEIRRTDDVATRFEIGTDSCALCAKFYPDDSLSPCMGCPLFHSLGDVRCDRMGQPYHKWIVYDDPSFMIKALRNALKWAKANS